MSDWIMCKDRLPETSDDVLCCKQLKNGSLVMCFGRYEGDFVNYKGEPDPCWSTSGGNHNVIAWMPLPEMPKV